MRKWFIITCLALAVAVTGCTQGGNEGTEKFQGTYSFRSDLANTGIIHTTGLPNLKGEKWSLQLENKIHSSPILADGILYFGDEAGQFYAISANNGKIIWQQAFAGKIRATAAVYENELYFTDTTSTLYAIDKTNGEVKWKKQLDDSLSSGAFTDPWDYYISSPTIDQDVIYVGGEGPFFYALSRLDGSIIWEHETPMLFVHSKAAIADGKVFISDMTGVVAALDQKTGEPIWSQDYGAVQSSIAYKDGILYFGSRDQNAYAVDAQTGEIKWSYLTSGGSWISSSAAVNDEYIAIGSSDSKFVHVFDPATGKSKFDFNAGSRVFGSPVIVDDIMYFGTAFTDKTVKANIDAFYAVDLKTGKEKWRFAEAQSPILSTPVVADGVVFFTTLDGHVYALN